MCGACYPRVMSFPLTLAGTTFETAPALAEAVVRDAQMGGGTIVEGRRPSRWLAACVTDGELDRKLAVGLCAALIRAPRPAAIAEAARLAEALCMHEVAALLPAALDAHDVGVLLFADAALPGRSVEDALLRSWGTLLADDDEDGRVDLLRRLRHAGLRDIELAVLARVGSAHQIRRLLPDILVEELATAGVSALAQALVRGQGVAEAVCELASELSDGQRHAVWRVAVSRGAVSDGALREAWLGA